MTEPGKSGGDGDGRIVRIVHNLGFERATSQDDLLGLGLTSLQILQASADIEREFGMTVDLSMLLAAQTLGELEEHLIEYGRNRQEYGR